MTWVAFDFLLTRAMCQLDLELHLESPYNLQSPLSCINQSLTLKKDRKIVSRKMLAWHSKDPM